MSNRRPVWYSVYYLSALLLITPLFDLMSQAFPPQPDQLVWRYGFLGLLSNNLLTPLLGLVLAAVAASMLEQRKVLRALSVFSFVVCAVLAAATVLFVLDVVQLGPSVDPREASHFHMGAFIAIGKYAVSFIGYLAVGWTGMRATRLEHAGAMAHSSGGHGKPARIPLLRQADRRA